MDKDKLKELIKSEKYISGIYNYCDRWCEKCTFTNKCLSYEMSHNSLDDKTIITDKKFWADLENSFKVVKDMLDDYMKEHNISFPTKNENDKIEHEMKKVDRLVKADPILLEAQNYNRFSSELIREFNHLLESITETHDESSAAKLNTAKEFVEVIQFYKNLIFVKISRALHTYYSKEDHNFEGYEEDKLISARIAIIAIERSMTSWHFIFEHFRNLSDPIIDILLQLSNIKTKLEKIIPSVVNYKRPFFD